MTLIAFLIALLAIATAQPTPPASFSEYVDSGLPILQADFIGWEWVCGPDDDERCYAGLQNSPDGMDEPTFNWVLTTGP